MPGTPRPVVQDPPHVIIRIRPPKPESSEPLVRYCVERNAALSLATPRGFATGSGSAESSSTHAPTPRTLNSTPNVSSSLTITGPAEGAVTEEHRSYEFSEVLEPSASTDQIVQSVIPNVLDQIRNGYNAAILCYGQTGSGKTYTTQQLLQALLDAIFNTASQPTPPSAGTPIEGPSLSAIPSFGLSHAQSSSPIFDAAKDLVEISYIQIYGNQSYDLLMCNKNNTRREGGNAASSLSCPMGEVLPKPKGVLVSEPFTLVASAQEVLQRVAEAQKRRVTAPHALNPLSSRSHSLLSFRISKCVDGLPVQSVKVTLADLAGSERVKKSGVQGEMLGDAIAINKSLLVLHSVIKAHAAAADNALATTDKCEAPDSTGPQPNPLVPFRESLLTLYLAPVLSNSYLCLITTVAPEACFYHETKSSLEFATTAKRCIVTRTRGRAVTDRVGGGKLVELELQQEIETLRHKVEILLEELDLERQKKDWLVDNEERKQFMAKLAASAQMDPTDAPPSYAQLQLRGSQPAAQVDLAIIKEHIGFLEHQFTSLQQVLKDREAEKALLISRTSVVEDIKKELEQRQADRDEARNALSNRISILIAENKANAEANGQPSDANDTLLSSLDKVLESFLWLEEEYQKSLENNLVVEKALSSLRAEHFENSQTILRLRKLTWTLEKQYEEAEEAIALANSELNEMTHKYHDLEFAYYREKQERATTDECILLHNSAGVRYAELEKVKQNFDEQSALLESVQSRVTALERELEASELSRMKLTEDLKAREQSIRLAWNMLTPQQRGKFLSFGVTSSAVASLSLAERDGTSQAASPSNAEQQQANHKMFQGYENVQLRSHMRDLQKKFHETELTLQQRTYRVQDLEDQYYSLTERIQMLEDENETLRKAENRHEEDNDELQHQVAELVQQLDAHVVRKNFLEGKYLEAQMELEKLEEERKSSQRVISELTNKLDKSIEELRSHEQSKGLLTARLREAEAEKTTMARQRAEDQARVAELERQLRAQISYTNDVTRRLDLAKSREQSIAAEITNHSKQGEFLHKKLVRLNPEEAKKRIAQVAKAMEPKLAAAGARAHQDPAAALAVHMGMNNKAAHLRFEVSQLFKNHNVQKLSDYEAMSSVASDLGNSPLHVKEGVSPQQSLQLGSPRHHYQVTGGVGGLRYPQPVSLSLFSSLKRNPPPPPQLSGLKAAGPTTATDHLPQSAATAATTNILSAYFSRKSSTGGKSAQPSTTAPRFTKVSAVQGGGSPQHTTTNADVVVASNAFVRTNASHSIQPQPQLPNAAEATKIRPVVPKLAIETRKPK